MLLALLLAGCTPSTLEVDPSSAQGLSSQTSSLLAPEHRAIADIRDAVSAQDETAVSVVQSYLDVIEDKDDTINAVTALNPLALQQARDLDRRIATGDEVGDLAGVPFLVKDNMDVAGMPTTAGSVALANNYPPATAPVVQRLLDQDAILLGKSNMSEFAASYGRLGYSSAGGLTLNPANTARDASGSSSGSAAAVAAGMAVFALGSDTGGSVRGPASVTGSVGVRPTFGLLPRTGVVPLALAFDTVGAITSGVSDQRLLLEVMTGPDAGDPQSVTPPEAFSLAEGSTSERRIGVVTAFTGGNPEVDAAFNDTITMMSDAGVETVPVEVPEEFSSIWGDVLGPVGDAEFAEELDGYLATSPPGTLTTLEQLIEFYASPAVSHSAYPVNPARLEGLRAALAAEGTLGDPAIREIVDARMPELRRQVQSILDANDLDALAFPTMACVATPRFDAEDASYSCSSEDPYTASYLASATGMPEATVPIGVDEQGLPVGLSFLGEPYTEGLLLDLGSLVIN